MKGNLCSFLILFGFPVFLGAADWPQYRGDAARSGYTAESLPSNLSLQWVRVARHAPQPAWSGRDTRMPFDRAYQTVIAGKTLFFGSSADCKIYALDAATGAERWTFFTGAPVRFAPVVWKDRVFAASDDGYLYCLSAEDGKLLWQKRGGADESMVLGNDRMVSRWPARGGLVMMDDTLYFGAGIWTAEKIFIYAINPRNGKVLWVNDTAGNLPTRQPHGDLVKSGVSAQGYLAANEERLFVPTGRSLPGFFDRSNGQFLYLNASGKSGGSGMVVGKEVLFSSGGILDVKTGKGSRGKSPRMIVAVPEGTVSFTGGAVKASKWARTEKKNKKGKVYSIWAAEDLWSTNVSYGGSSLVVAGQSIVSGGKKGKKCGICLVDAASRKMVWSSKLEGDPLGLAVADKRLYVTTDQGNIYCFGTGGGGGTIKVKTENVSYKDQALYEKAAKEIVKESGITTGYCLDLNCGDGGLSYALAKQTKLHIYAIDKDPKKVAIARQKLDAAGLYGVRVTVHQGNPAKTAYPNYGANLVVSGRSIISGAGLNPKEVQRVLNPRNGIALVGKPGAMKKTFRKPLKDTGEWTHQYADAANTLCAPDRVAKGPLKMLWFTDFNFEMPNRHGRGPAPLSKGGILVVEGVDGLLGVDAYNGHRIWDVPIPGILKAYDGEHLLGTAGTHSNMCLGEDSVFVRLQGKCLRIALATGKKLREYSLPDPSGVWGYIAYHDGILFASSAIKDYVVRKLYGKGDMKNLLTQSGELFALDVNTGKPKWSYKAKHAIRHNAIAIGAGRVYLIDRPVAMEDKVGFGKKKGEDQKAESDSKPPTAPGILYCLDTATGQVIWRDNRDIFGTTLVLSTKYKILVMGYQYSQRSFQLPSEKGDRLAGIRIANGKRLWDEEGKYISRPMINNRTIYTQPFARDLMTGKKNDKFQLTGRGKAGCGTISGSTYLQFFRSGTLGYVDLLKGGAIESYGPIRPGCWINAIVAGGIVLIPDATDRCTCSYLIKSSVALQPQ